MNSESSTYRTLSAAALAQRSTTGSLRAAAAMMQWLPHRFDNG
jgi:hypothetical protein